jgi:hypothetical protein
MWLEEWLDILAKRYRVEMALIAAGLTRPERGRLLAEIKESIVLELEHQPLSERTLMVEAERLLLTGLLGQGFSLPAGPLSRARLPRHAGGLNEAEAVCLWLGMFRQQTFGLAGFWQIYLDLEEAPMPVPQVIAQVFEPRGEEGENQEYIGAQLQEAHRSGLELTDRDTSKIIAWVMETHPRLGARDPVAVARELRKHKSKPVNAVDQNLLRGGNTLMDEFVRRVCREIDNIQGDKEEML